MSDNFLAQWARTTQVGTVLTPQDIFTLRRIAQALDNADKHHAQARAAESIVHAASLVAAIIVDGNVRNVSVRDFRQAQEDLIALCFGEDRFGGTARRLDEFYAARQSAPQEVAHDER